MCRGTRQFDSGSAWLFPRSAPPPPATVSVLSEHRGSQVVDFYRSRLSSRLRCSRLRVTSAESPTSGERTNVRAFFFYRSSSIELLPDHLTIFRPEDRRNEEIIIGLVVVVPLWSRRNLSFRRGKIATECAMDAEASCARESPPGRKKSGCSRETAKTLGVKTIDRSIERRKRAADAFSCSRRERTNAKENGFNNTHD